MVQQYTRTHCTIQWVDEYVQYLVVSADQQLVAAEEEKVFVVGTVLPVAVQVLEEARRKIQQGWGPVVKVVGCTIGLAGGVVVGA